MEVGTVVCSSAGSDKDNLFVVVKNDGSKIYISDGKRRKLASPKAKNPKHLLKTDHRLNLETVTTDKALRKALATLRSNI